jgi:alginate O-acetyltransferase complex protein AlgI
MVFSSFTFLFLFLPVTLLINYVLPKKYSNTFLLIVSLLFYYYGEKGLTLLLLFSICWNFVIALVIERQQTQPKNYAYSYLVLCVVGNLSLLFYYKYLLFFIKLLGITSLTESPFLKGIAMPIGISFFTFHGLSYVVDVYRKHTSASKNILDLGLYLAYFPQLIAGPIIKYHDIHVELKNRVILLTEVYSGINRFIRGLAKKIILANNFAFIADEIMNTPTMELSSVSAWVGILCYTLQIYYDFAGYSDMAIGLARMMGFHFKENFNYPYIATSIQDFWRRWHISLSTWFKEYVYIPLGGNQRKNGRVLLNLLIVFVLTGLWHGASINFLVWGLIHGLFIILERLVKFNQTTSYSFLRRIYTLLVVIVAWVFFRVESFEGSCIYLQKLVACDVEGSNYFLTLITPYTLALFLVGIVYVMPVKRYIYTSINRSTSTVNYSYLVSVFHLLLLLFSLMELSSLSYNPFIYFRF